MPRTPAKPRPQQKRGKGTSARPKLSKAKTPAKSAELTELARDFEAKLRLCSPQERKFVLAKLDGFNNADAAKKADYSGKTARQQGSRLLTRVNVSDAIKAGWSARGLTPDAVLAGIREMLEFDPGEVTSYVNEVVKDWEEVPASAALADVRAELEIAEEFLRNLPPRPGKPKRGLPPEPDVYETERTVLEVEVTRLRKRETQLALLVRKTPDATVLQQVERLKRVPYIDLEKVQESGKAKYISGIKNTPQGRNIELVAHKDVLEMAGRAHGIFREQHVHTGPDGGPIQTQTTLNLDEATGEQIAQLYAEMLGQADER